MFRKTPAMRRPLCRVVTVTAITGYLLGTIGLLSAATASAEPTDRVSAPVVEPAAPSAPPAADNSAAWLHSPLLTVPQGRKFR